MDDEMQSQLRTITFTEERKGFDKREVREFLAEVADWIDGGGGDVVRRRLERIAHKSAQMLADAEDGAEGLRREAEQEARAALDSAKAEGDSYRNNAETEAREQLRDARAEATSSREAANQYASETRASADEYAEQTRYEAKEESDELRDKAAKEAKKTVRAAEQRSEQLIAEATRRREDIETVIRDLELKRGDVGAQVRKLAQQLEETVDGIEREAKARPASPTAEAEPVPAATVEETEPVEGLRAV
jgi:DivIVA domain-containing protein